MFSENTVMSPFKFSGPDPDRPKPFGELTLARGQIQGARDAQRQRELLEHLYDRSNARDMEAVLATMHRDVMWANGMEGGHVYGHDGVRDYWTRQWATIDSHVEAAGFSEVILYFNVGLKPHNQVKDEMARFMAEVAPAFAKSRG